MENSKNTSNNTENLKFIIRLLIVIVIILLLILINAQSELKYANDRIYELNEENTELKESYSNNYSNSYSNNTSSSSSTNSSYNTSSSTSSTSFAQTTTLSDGSYRVPDDIPAGTYNVTAKEGYGLLTGDFASGFVSTTIGYDSSTGQTRTYNNLKLSNGDEFTIVSGCTMVFTPR